MKIPWMYVASEGWIVDNDGNVIASVDVDDEQGNTIAAAPDLLAALEEALAHAMRPDDTAPHDFVLNEWRALIAKARGGA